jgi:site-specific DNA-methyltransferase (adenine-specific)
LVLDPFCGSGTTLVAADLLGRNSLGIDVAAEAVELARQRLAQPVKTSSELLRKGREAYVQSDEEALACLCGLPIVAVQRNRGIDAILSARPGENPILIRVQRRGESVADAAELLYSAGQSKQPVTMVVVVTDSRQPSGLFNMLPPDVLFVNSTATELVERLADRGIGKLSTQ